LLADRGQHRAPSIPDLIIAAELAGLPCSTSIRTSSSLPRSPASPSSASTSS